jgi:hypothetical protein
MAIAMLVDTPRRSLDGFAPRVFNLTSKGSSSACGGSMI